MKNIFVILSVFMLMSLNKDSELELISKFKLKIKEPSDLCLTDKKRLYIVSDNGNLYETNLKGEILKESKYEGYDFEAITCDKDFLYVSEESNRKISVFDFELNYIKSFILSYQGGRNKGFEAMCYNETLDKFCLISEKDPNIKRIYNKDFTSFEEMEMIGFSDVSSISFHNKFYWILSDEDHTLYQYDSDFNLKDQLELPVLNPEGITFISDSTFLIISDDMQLIYTFKWNK